MRAAVRYSIGYELDDELNIHRVPRAYVNEPNNRKNWKSWQEVFPEHRYTTEYESNYPGSTWHRRLN